MLRGASLLQLFDCAVSSCKYSVDFGILLEGGPGEGCGCGALACCNCLRVPFDSVTVQKHLNIPQLCCRRGLEKALAEGYDSVIVDTAGRLQIDQDMMDELVQVG